MLSLHIDDNLNRDKHLDLLKVIACMLVVFLHSKGVVVLENNAINYNNLMMEAFCAPCVEIFFITSGFYLYKKDSSYIKKLKRLFFDIIIPFLLFVLIFINLNKWLLGVKNLEENFQELNLKENLLNIYLCFRHNTSKFLPNTLNHLWYVFSYIEIIIFFPISNFFIHKFNKYVKYIILAICIFFMAQNDYRLLTNNDWMYNLFFTIPKAIVISIIGCELFNNIIKKKIFDNNKKLWLSIFCSLSVILLFVSYFMQKYFYENGGVYYFNSWDSFITFIRTVLLCFIIYLIDFKNNKLITFIAKNTFFIYLFHYVILQRFLVRYVDEHFRSKCSNAIEDYLFGIIFAIVVFGTTLLLCIIVNEIKYRITNYGKNN